MTTLIAVLVMYALFAVVATITLTVGGFYLDSYVGFL